MDKGKRGIGKGWIRYKPAAREKAFRLYCSGVKDAEIAKRLGVTRVQTISDWRTKYGWCRRLREIEAAGMRKARGEFDADRVQRIAERLQEHDQAGKGLRSAAISVLNAELSKIRRVADALTSDPAAAEKLPFPGPLTLTRIGQALRMAIYLERQAMGLPLDGSKGPDDGKDIDELTRAPLEELEAIYKKVRELVRND